MMSQGNRGMQLEALINHANEQYMARGMAVVHKRPTPVKIIRTQGSRITAAVLESKSTVDYQGVYRGHALEFEAKQTSEKTRFPLDNIHQHQVDHLRACAKQGAVTFLIVEFTKWHKVFYLPGKVIVDAWDQSERGGRKSVPYEDIERMCFTVTQGRGIVLDYLAIVDQTIAQEAI